MGKTLEATIHEAELPAPAPGGEDFQSYVSRVAHAAAFLGAAWAIANGPQVQAPAPVPTFQPGDTPTVDLGGQQYAVTDQDEHEHDGLADGDEVQGYSLYQQDGPVDDDLPNGLESEQ